MGFTFDPIKITRTGSIVHVAVEVRPELSTTILFVGPIGAERLDQPSDADGRAEFDFEWQGKGTYLFDIFQGDDLEHDVAETVVDL